MTSDKAGAESKKPWPGSAEVPGRSWGAGRLASKLFLAGQRFVERLQGTSWKQRDEAAAWLQAASPLRAVYHSTAAAKHWTAWRSRQ